MKIIILAAGKGERLMPLTKNTPKPLLDMGNGNTLLEEQIISIKDSGVIDEIILVIGFLAEQVEAKIKMHIHNGVKIKTIFNPFYEVSNNLMSLWFAKNEMDSDFMISNGDNLFTPDVFNELAEENEAGIFLSLNKKEKYDVDDMKTIIQNGVIAEVSKKIPSIEAHAESPGLALIKSERFINLFKENLQLLGRSKEYINSFWLEVFNLFYKRGIPVHPWIFDGSAKWQEVDFHVDVNKMKELLKLKIDMPESEKEAITFGK